MTKYGMKRRLSVSGSAFLTYRFRLAALKPLHSLLTLSAAYAKAPTAHLSRRGFYHLFLISYSLSLRSPPESSVPESPHPAY